MITIASSALEIDLLDPNNAHPAHGIRYCRGGYIWQARNNSGTPLLSGPEYPNPQPTAFNGQGLPEVFRHENKRTNQFLTRNQAGRGFILGVGTVHGAPGANGATLEAPAEWDISHQSQQCTMQSSYSYEPWACTLTRTITVDGLQLRSHTTLENTSTEAALPLHWYAHPFFPHSNGLTSCNFDQDIAIESNPGYLNEGSQIAMNPSVDWHNNDHFAWLDWPEGRSLNATMSHPVYAGIRMQIEHGINYMPIWSNKSTLSIEPYITLNIACSETHSWEICYDFLDE